MGAPSAASGAPPSADGTSTTYRVGDDGCLRSTERIGAAAPARAARLAGFGVFPDVSGSTPCAMGRRTWRSGAVTIATSPGATRRMVEVTVRRVPHVQASDWRLSRVEDRAVVVRAPIDQCSPRAGWRVEESRTEVRIRSVRPPGSVSCTLVAYGGWGDERRLRLDAPLGDRTLVLERAPVRNDYLDEICGWERRAIAALVAREPFERRLRRARGAPTWGYGDDPGWTWLLEGALRTEDAALAARQARGIRVDMRRFAVPEGCEREPVVPERESEARTELVVSGTFGDARLVGLDRERKVTWTSELRRGRIDAIVPCPDASIVLVVEVVSRGFRYGAGDPRGVFVDATDGAERGTVALPRPRDAEDDQEWAVAACESGVLRRGIVLDDASTFFRPRNVVYRIDGGVRTRLPDPGYGVDAAVGAYFLGRETDWDDPELARARPWLRPVDGGPAHYGPWRRAAWTSASPDQRTLVADRGPMDVYDVSQGTFRLQRTIPALRAQRPVDRQHDSLVWRDDRTLLRIAWAKGRGRLFEIDVPTGVVRPTGVWPRERIQASLEHHGELLGFDPHLFEERPGLLCSTRRRGAGGTRRASGEW